MNVPDLHPAYEKMNPQRWLKTIVLADTYLCLGFERRRLFEHRPFELLLSYSMKKCWSLTTSFLLATLTPASHSSGSSFINSFGLVAMFGMQYKFVPNTWTCCKGTFSVAVSTGSETTRCYLLNGGNYWSFLRAYRDCRDGDREWTLMNWLLWSFPWNQAVVLNCFGLQQILPTLMTHTEF